MKKNVDKASSYQVHYKSISGKSRGISKSVQDRMHRYVNIAKALFRRGYTSNGRTFNVCFAVKKNKILAIGINDYTRIMPEYSKNLKMRYKVYGERSYHPCLHAEMSAVMKLGSDNCEGLSFFNIRLNKMCHCCNSQPCMNCLNVLMSVNIKNLYYYDDDMNICCI